MIKTQSLDRYFLQRQSWSASWVTRICVILSGHYGSWESIGIVGAILIRSRLLTGGLLVLLVDEVLNVGYGIGSSILLVAPIIFCGSIVWHMFLLQVIYFEHGSEYQGAIVGFFYLLWAGAVKDRAFHKALFRSALSVYHPDAFD
jgi:protein transport protein SEC61 subunit alpha